jgi:hypothetical protein
VAPNTRLSYVPTAALVARRAALKDVAGPGGVFDPALRYGEDVDLVWRLHRCGWRVRYDPTVRVRHEEPATWPALLDRRLRYGTSAAALARRHPGDVPPLVVDPWPALTVAALLLRRPAAAVATFALGVLQTTRTLRGHDLPSTDAWRYNAGAVAKTWFGAGRYATRYAPALVLAGMLARGRRGTGAAALSLLAGPGVVAWAARRPSMSPLTFVIASIADDLAYGAGVWAGCVRHRTVAPLRPVLVRHRRKRDTG